MSLANTVRAGVRKDTIVKKRYERWLLEHGDDPIPDWVAQRIAQQMSKPPRVRQGTFSASSAGSCLRAQELSFLGYQPTILQTPTPQLMNVFNDGKWRHLRHQANLLASGIITDMEYPLDWPRRRAFGTMDGFGFVPDNHPIERWRDEPFGLELKGVNPFQYPRQSRQEDPIEKYLRQIARYVLMRGMKLFVVLNENKGTNELREWVIEVDQKMVDESDEELRLLNKAVDQRRLHPLLASCKLRMGKTWEDCQFSGRQGTCEKTKRWIESEVVSAKDS